MREEALALTSEGGPQAPVTEQSDRVGVDPRTRSQVIRAQSRDINEQRTREQDVSVASSPAASARQQHTSGLVRHALENGDGTQASQPGEGGGVHLPTSGGSPLPRRAFFESAFGEDFSDVRVHASESRTLDPLGAEAAAEGEHIFLGAASGDVRVMSHELTHVVQQRRAGPAPASSQSVSQPSDASEHEARAVGDAVAAGQDALEI